MTSDAHDTAHTTRDAGRVEARLLQARLALVCSPLNLHLRLRNLIVFVVLKRILFVSSSGLLYSSPWPRFSIRCARGAAAASVQCGEGLAESAVAAVTACVVTETPSLFLVVSCPSILARAGESAAGNSGAVRGCSALRSSGPSLSLPVRVSRPRDPPSAIVVRSAAASLPAASRARRQRQRGWARTHNETQAQNKRAHTHTNYTHEQRHATRRQHTTRNAANSAVTSPWPCDAHKRQTIAAPIPTRWHLGRICDDSALRMHADRFSALAFGQSRHSAPAAAQLEFAVRVLRIDCPGHVAHFSTVDDRSAEPPHTAAHSLLSSASCSF